MSEPRWCDVAD